MRYRLLRLAPAVSIACALSLNAPERFAQAPRPLAPPGGFTAQDALDIVGASIGDLSDDGRWLAATSLSRRDGLSTDFRRDGDPTYIRPQSMRVWVADTRTGKTEPVFADKRNVRALRWSPDGARLAMLVVEDDGYQPVVWDHATKKLTRARIPVGKYVAENSDLRWTPDGQRLVFALRAASWRKAVQDSFAIYTKGPVFVQSSKDPFLAWDGLRRSANERSVVAYDFRTGDVQDLVPEIKISNYALSEDGTVVTYSQDITRKTDYDVIFGTENILIAKRPGGEPRTLLPTLKNVTVVWAEDGKHFAYGKEGRVYLASVDDTTSRLVAGPPADAKRSDADTTKEAREKQAKERFVPVRYSPTLDALVISNTEGLWVVDLPGNGRSLISATSDSNTTAPRTSTLTWSPDGKRVYLLYGSRTKWERGILRYDRDEKRVDTLVKDSRSYSGFRLSKDGRTAVVAIAQGNRPPELYAADANLSDLHQLGELNPQLKDKLLGSTELITYLDADGHAKHGVVYLPPRFVRGRAYPTVFNIYEDFFDDSFDATANVLTGAGYVVVKPSVDFDIGYPGEAWVKGVTAAANKLIEMGIADSARLGVHGTSYGGYATNLLITQTNRFKAAINISGKVDIISFYTDSPRLGVRNVHAAEKSQDRLGATLWQQPQKYVAHSAIMFADRIQTPLMLITGEQDSNVPADNTREMYYALRRLGREVVWVNYMNGGHGGGNATAEDFLDFHKRIVDWYDAKLKKGLTVSVAR